MQDRFWKDDDPLANKKITYKLPINIKPLA